MTHMPNYKSSSWSMCIQDRYLVSNISTNDKIHKHVYTCAKTIYRLRIQANLCLTGQTIPI